MEWTANIEYKLTNTKMRDALNNIGRSFFYSLCFGGNDKVSTWGKNVGNSWGTTYYIYDNWGLQMGKLAENSFILLFF